MKRKYQHHDDALTADQKRAQDLLSFDDLRLFGIRYSRGHLYRLIKAKKFPQPVRLGEARVAFAREAIVEHIAKIKATAA